MIGLLTGGTGDGKTLYAVTMLLHDAYKANRAANALVPGTEHVPCDDEDEEFIAAMAASQKKWQPLRDFRSNIKGLKIPGVPVMPLEKDWRQYRDGTVCVYDESHKKGYFRTTGKPGLSDDDVITELDEHRHRAFDIWFITQFPTKIHHEIRQLVKRHIHLVRSHGMQRSMLYDWQKAVNNPEQDESVIALGGEIWEFRVEGYGWYKSTSMDTHKLVVPKALKRALVGIPLIAILLGGIAWGVSWATADDRDVGKTSHKGEQAQAAPGVAPPSGGEVAGSVFPPGMEWAAAGTVPKFKGCAVLTKVCRCWNGEGAQLLLSESECRSIALQPLPVDFSSGQEAQAVAVSVPATVAADGAFPLAQSFGLGMSAGSSGSARIGDVNPGVSAASAR